MGRDLIGSFFVSMPLAFQPGASVLRLLVARSTSVTASDVHAAGGCAHRLLQARSRDLQHLGRAVGTRNTLAGYNPAPSPIDRPRVDRKPDSVVSVFDIHPRQYHARKGIFSTAAGGIVGYVKLSIMLLGPDDTPVIHEEEDEDEDEGESAVLLPPTLKREVVFIRVAVHCAQHLPVVDTYLGSIDPYIELWCAGVKAKTAVRKENRNPEWHLEFWLPVLVPSFGTRLRLSLKDWNRVGSNEEIETWDVGIDEIMRSEDGTLAWFHLYGLSAAAKLTKASIRGAGKSAARRKLRKYKSEYESEWHGQLLVGLRAEKPDDRGIRQPHSMPTQPGQSTQALGFGPTSF